MSQSEKPLRESETQPAAGRGWLRDLLDFAVRNKWWWIVPILILLLLAILLVLVGGGAVSPFMYS